MINYNDDDGNTKLVLDIRNIYTPEYKKGPGLKQRLQTRALLVFRYSYTYITENKLYQYVAPPRGTVQLFFFIF